MSETIYRTLLFADDLELRQENDDAPAIISGTVIKYGDVANVRSGGIQIRERMEPGVFGRVSDLDIMAVLQHERSRGLARQGYGLKLIDDSTALRAELELDDSSDGRDALIKVKRRILRGFSAEFRPRKSRIDTSGPQPVLVRQQAELVRIGVVDRPAYPESTLQLRQAEIDALVGNETPGKPAFDPWR